MMCELQVDNFNTLNGRIESGLVKAIAERPEDPEGYLDRVFKNIFESEPNDLEHAFLHVYGNTGIKLSKATDNSLTDWTEISLDSSGNVMEIPCE